MNDFKGCEAATSLPACCFSAAAAAAAAPDLNRMCMQSYPIGSLLSSCNDLLQSQSRRNCNSTPSNHQSTPCPALTIAITPAAPMHGPHHSRRAYAGCMQTGNHALRMPYLNTIQPHAFIRLILANIAGLTSLSTTAASIASAGPDVGSSDAHAAELLGCKSIIKKM